MEIERIAVKVSAAAERKIKSGHPWIFDKAIEKESKDPKAGDLAIIYARKTNKLLAVGLYDPSSVIRIKIISNAGPVELDQKWFDEKSKLSIDKREAFEKTYTNAYRVIHGENDGFPGLIVDKYAEYLVVKVYSEIWLVYMNQILKTLKKLLPHKGILLRTSRLVQTQTKENPIYKDGSVLLGEIPEEIEFLEFGLKFKTNLRKGHKTGHFLDQRHNRHKISKLAKGKKVLDVFAYTGGFSVHAFSGGAKEVSSLDISKHALGLAERNVELNFKNVKHHKLEGDAFDTMRSLANVGKRFDLIIVDPPSFAKREKEVSIALKKYGELVRLAVNLVSKKGVLLMASCSSRVSNEDFFTLVDENIKGSKRKFTLLEKTYHDIDHPIGFPESAYLKGVYYSFD